MTWINRRASIALAHQWYISALAIITDVVIVNKNNVAAIMLAPIIQGVLCDKYSLLLIASH